MRIFEGLTDDFRSHCQTGEFFWLDLLDPTTDTVEQMGQLLSIHELAVEDSIRFDQRPKLDDYDEYALLVLKGGRSYRPEEDNPNPLEEVHVYVSGAWVVTIHKNVFDDLDRLKKSVARPDKSEQYYVYKIVDAIVDSFFPILEDLDGEISDLEEDITDGGRKEQIKRIFRMKRLLLDLRKAVIPMRDVFARDIDTITNRAGLEGDSRDYFRDVYDHLIRMTDMLDGYHEMVSGCTDLYLSVRADRQGEISKQLTIVASIFLPLTFVTGFFGMNFGWMDGTVLKGAWTFFVLGCGTMAVSAIAMWAWFRHRGWLGDS